MEVRFEQLLSVLYFIFYCSFFFFLLLCVCVCVCFFFFFDLYIYIYIYIKVLLSHLSLVTFSLPNHKHNKQ